MRLLTMPRAQHLFASVLAISPGDPSATVDEARAASARIAAAVGSATDRASLETVPEFAFFEARHAALEPADDKRHRDG